MSIELTDLHVRYGHTFAVKGLTLTVPTGSCFGLLGPNGAGKSSTIRCVATTQAPSSGRIMVGGYDVSAAGADVRALLGVVPQGLALYDSLTVNENLRVFGGLYGLAGAALHRRIDWGLELSQLTASRAMRVSALSGGMKRRLNIAVSSAPCTAMFAPGERAKLTLWVDPSHQTEADIVQGLLTKAMMESVFSQIGDPATQRKTFAELRASLGSADAERPELARFLDQGAAFAAENDARAADAGVATTPAEAGGSAMKPPLDVVVETVVAAGPTAHFNGYAHTFAGMLMQFLLFSASAHAKTLFAERTSGTLDRLRMTTASRAQILLGTAAGIGIVSMLASLVIFGAAMVFFDVSLRSGPLAFTCVVVGQAALVGSFALLLAGLADSEKQLDSLGTMTILFLCFVSGAWVPSFMLPGFLQDLGPLVPTRWLLDGMAGATWRGLGLGHALQSMVALFGFSAVFAAIGLRRFRWG